MISENDLTKTKPAEPRQYWGIAEMAAHFSVTPRAIRFYEDKGLLTPKRVGGHRVFDAHDRERVEKILRAKRIGFSLDDVKQFLDVTDGAVYERAALISRKSSFEVAIKRLRRKRRDIEIITKDMQDLCALIDEYVKTAPESEVFQFASAYDAMFRQHLDEDFLPF